MDNKDFLIKEDTLTNIADNIRNVDSTLDKMTPTEMADAIKRLTAVIDERYNASSTNPQSGIAVAEGIQQERQRAQLAEEQNEQNIINETAERKQADSELQSQIDNIEATSTGTKTENNAIVLGDTPTEDALAPSSIIGGKNNKNGCKGWKVTSIEKSDLGVWTNQPSELSTEWYTTNCHILTWGGNSYQTKTSSTNKFKLYAMTTNTLGKDLLAFDTEFTKQDVSSQTDVDIFANEGTVVNLYRDNKTNTVKFAFAPLFKVVCEGIDAAPDIAVGDFLNIDCVFHSYQLRANKVVKDEINKTTTLYIYTTMALQYGEGYSFVWLEKDPYAGDTVVLMDKDQLTDNYDTSVTFGSNTENNGYMGTAIGSEVINRGKYGVALGGGAKTLGYTGIAMGRKSQADQSISIGQRSKTTNGASAIGDDNFGYGESALLGSRNVSVGTEASILGNNNTNIGTNEIVGNNNRTQGLGNFVLGAFNTIKGSGTYIVGANNSLSKPIGGDVFMIGRYNVASYPYAYMLGERLVSGRAVQTNLGQWNEGNPDTVFELGDGAGPSNKINALTVRLYSRQNGARGYALRLGNKSLNCELTDDDFKKLHNIQTDLDKKLDKQTSNVFKVYGTRYNKQIMTEVSDSSEAKINTIAMRDNQGHLATKTPTLDTHAANKYYVDTKIDALNKQIVSFDIYSSKTEFTTVDVLIPSK